MSVPVALEALHARLDEYGPVAFLVTVNEQGTAHVVSVEVRTDGDQLVVPTGRSTRRNLEHNPHLTLLWPLGHDPAYSMIVDATVTSLEDDEATIAPQSAVLHRVAGSNGDGPVCVPVTRPDA
jgi:hypothetical protein